MIIIQNIRNRTVRIHREIPIFRFDHLNIGIFNLPFDMTQGGELVEPFRISIFGFKKVREKARPFEGRIESGSSGIGFFKFFYTIPFIVHPDEILILFKLQQIRYLHEGMLGEFDEVIRYSQVKVVFSYE